MSFTQNKFFNKYSADILIQGKVWSAILDKYGIQRKLFILLTNLYLYSSLNKPIFSFNKAQKLTSWNYYQLKSYFTVLLAKGYIIDCTKGDQEYKRYKLAPIVNEIVRYYSNMHAIYERTALDKFK
jgi:hypothetical protein